MPRKGKVTLAGTSVPQIIAMVLDTYISEQKENLIFGRLTRPKFIEIAILEFLDRRGKLESLLAKHGCSNTEVESIKQYLKLVGQILK